ncbi:hypothetical protein VdG1_03429 [Verticillium dahliae VDG1]|nr:hypothetical protein VdG1_03429 [Verticillium dahliae VDG1]
MSVDEIKDVIRRFAETARITAEAGFQDAYGGSPAKRARFAVEIVEAIRAVVPKEFCVGIKLNSVDHQSKAELSDCVEQLKLIAQAGVDFIEMSRGPSAVEGKSERTKAREAFFLDFAAAIRDQFPDVPLVEIDDASAKLYAKKIESPWFLQKIGLKNVGAGIEISWYSKAMGDIDPTKASL